jgi:hypothetical protein
MAPGTTWQLGCAQQPLRHGGASWVRKDWVREERQLGPHGGASWDGTAASVCVRWRHTEEGEDPANAPAPLPSNRQGARMANQAKPSQPGPYRVTADF